MWYITLKYHSNIIMSYYDRHRGTADRWRRRSSIFLTRQDRIKSATLYDFLLIFGWFHPKWFFENNLKTVECNIPIYTINMKNVYYRLLIILMYTGTVALHSSLNLFWGFVSKKSFYANLIRCILIYAITFIIQYKNYVRGTWHFLGVNITIRYYHSIAEIFLR